MKRNEKMVYNVNKVKGGKVTNMWVSVNRKLNIHPPRK